MRRQRLAEWFERRWYGGQSPGPVLIALSWLFAGLAALRRGLYRRGFFATHRMPVPVIAIGNLTVGGAGKTPLTLAIVEGLREHGWRPGVISRGVGGSRKTATRVTAESVPADVGDEPCLLARRTGVPVAVAAKRSDAARLLVDSGDVDLIIADDALQHLALGRDLEVLVIDGRRRFGNERLLPAGPLREPIARGRRCDFRVINGGERSALASGDWSMQLNLDRAVRLDGHGERSLQSLQGEAINAIAGIADPERFFLALRDQGLAVTGHGFPDHHDFAADDFAFDDGRPLLMTEKDAVKCQRFARPHWYAVPADSWLADAFFVALDARLRSPSLLRPSP